MKKLPESGHISQIMLLKCVGIHKLGTQFFYNGLNLEKFSPNLSQISNIIDVLINIWHAHIYRYKLSSCMDALNLG